MKKILFCILIMVTVNSMMATNKNIYILIHGLYQSHSHWNKFVDSQEFKDSEFTYGGNFHITEDMIRSKLYLITPDLEDEMKNLLTHDNLVFTIDLASAYENSYHDQGNQLADVLKLLPKKGYNYYLLGHSMGGLCARAYINWNKNRNIKGLVTIGTPNLGSYLGNASKSLTDFIGKMATLTSRPDNFFDGITNLWKNHKKNVVPALAPGSDELKELNSVPFPPEIKVCNIFSAINTTEEMNNLSSEGTVVRQALILEKVKAFNTLRPKDIDITTLYNDLYYNDGLVSIYSQSLFNAIPNKYEPDIYQIPTRFYHDNEPYDIKHLMGALRLIREKTTKEQRVVARNIFVYSSDPEIFQEEFTHKIAKTFFSDNHFSMTFTSTIRNKLEFVFLNSAKPYYKNGIFLINKTKALNNVCARIPSIISPQKIKNPISTFPIVADFSLGNNITKFEGKKCIYIKLISIDEATHFFRLISDLFNGKIYLRKSEFYRVKDLIIRYYFPNSNMTERLYIPDSWFLEHINILEG